MKPALIIIDELLKSTEMLEHEVDMLMARFLEEEAFDYVECVKEVQESNQKVRYIA